jgi:hypothetical protein
MIANAFLAAAATGAATASRNRLGRRRTSRASARENGQWQQGKKGMQTLVSGYKVNRINWLPVWSKSFSKSDA